MSFVDAIKSAADALRALSDGELLELAARAASPSTSTDFSGIPDKAPHTGGSNGGRPPVIQPAVLDLLRDATVPIPFSQIMDQCGLSRWSAKAAVDRLKRGGKIRLTTKGYVLAELPTAALRREVAKSAPKKEPRASTPSPPKTRANDNRRERILQFVLESKKELSTGDIAKALKLNPLVVSPMLRQLVKSGHVVWNQRQTNRSRVAAKKELLT